MEITLDNVESSAEVVKEVFKMSRAGITGHQIAETSLIRGRKSVGSAREIPGTVFSQVSFYLPEEQPTMRAALYFYELRQLYYVLYA